MLGRAELVQPDIGMHPEMGTIFPRSHNCMFCSQKPRWLNFSALLMPQRDLSSSEEGMEPRSLCSGPGLCVLWGRSWAPGLLPPLCLSPHTSIAPVHEHLNWTNHLLPGFPTLRPWQGQCCFGHLHTCSEVPTQPPTQEADILESQAHSDLAHTFLHMGPQVIHVILFTHLPSQVAGTGLLLSKALLGE